ncbi:MAG: hypothetical protein DRJ35_07950 [Thermoprotei archaeon]|nr:MAG: hypothetical protein DRJ35_07950 [Thermoprotei archaeon]
MPKKRKVKPEIDEVDNGVLDIAVDAPEEAFKYVETVNVANADQKFSAQLNDLTAIYNMTTGVLYIAEKAGLDFPINGTITDLLASSIIKLR